LEIFNRRGDALVEQLEMCGTPCRFLPVRWLNNDHFVFVKTHEYFEDRGEKPSLTGYEAYVTLYDLEADSVYIFKSDLILRRPSLYIDSMISLIWDNPEVVRSIHEKFEQAIIPGYRLTSLNHFYFDDSTEIVTEDCELLPRETDSSQFADDWTFSPDRSRAATICCEGEADSDIRLYNWHGDRIINRLGFCGATCRYLALRWLDDEKLLVLRIDEDAHLSRRTGRRVLDGHVAIVLLYNLSGEYVLTHGSYILMPD
jgi:hypothetical protein